MKLVFRAYCLILILVSELVKANPYCPDSIPATYDNCFQKINELLIENGSFREAVFITEKAFNDSLIKERDFDQFVDAITQFIQKHKQRFQLRRYHESDGENYLLNRAIASTLFDTLTVKAGRVVGKTTLFRYNFDDPLGKADWSNMFVSKLFVTHKGNCHSLAYLYKILADEVNAKCWLSLSPNHIYIRNFSRQIGWYNTETTSGLFPTDAWIATTGYVSTDAIRSGIYLDTLSNQQSIALCMLDLAKGYEFQTHNYYDGFILKCCDVVLQYHPVNPSALLLKAETLNHLYKKQSEEKNTDTAITYSLMEQMYIALAKLHYREMPETMYKQWLARLTKEKDRYTNKKMHKVVNAHKHPSIK